MDVARALCRAVIESGALSAGERLWVGTTPRRSYHLCFTYCVVELEDE